MNRPLPIWIAAAVPAALAGHAVAYALAGRSASDGHHAWMAPAYECSLAFLAAVALALLAGSLTRAGFLSSSRIERSFWALAPRMALAQLLLFTVMERAEGGHVWLAAVLVQVLIAAAGAYLLALFSGLLLYCAQRTSAAGRYLARLRHAHAVCFLRRLEPAVFAPAFGVGTSRFQRPPPCN